MRCSTPADRAFIAEDVNAEQLAEGLVLALTHSATLTGPAINCGGICKVAAMFNVIADGGIL